MTAKVEKKRRTKERAETGRQLRVCSSTANAENGCQARYFHHFTRHHCLMATLLWRTGAPKATLMPLSEPVEESSDGGQNETFSRIQRLNQLEGCGGIDGVGSPTRKLLKNQHIRRQGVAASPGIRARLARTALG